MAETEVSPMDAAGRLVREQARGGRSRHGRSVHLEPPTLISLGFEWQIDGDDNRNAAVTVSYSQDRRDDLATRVAAVRLQRERIDADVLRYTTPNMFAGSVFDLEPGTEYEGQFVLSDPDGVEGRGENSRQSPHPCRAKPFAGGHTSPRVSSGLSPAIKQMPAFTGLLAVYYMGSSGADNHNSFPGRVRPGDTILVHAGIYKDNRFRYGGGLGTLSDGTYFLTQSGTPDRPIVIKAAGDGEAIFDGDGVDTSST